MFIRTSSSFSAALGLVAVSALGITGCAVDATGADQAESEALLAEEQFNELSALVPEEKPGEVAVSDVDVDAPEEADDAENAEGEATEGDVRSVEQGLFNDCNNVDIKVTNNRQRYNSSGVLVRTPIKVRYVKFWDDTSNKWRKEGLADETLGYGDNHWWGNQKLEHSRGHRLTKWRAFYSYREADGDWSDTVYQNVEFDSRWSDHACTSNTAWYKLTVN